jgi:hypothetical protein
LFLDYDRKATCRRGAYLADTIQAHDGKEATPVTAERSSANWEMNLGKNGNDTGLDVGNLAAASRKA